ncbi:MAG: hypothetical protein HY735_00305 [Verrucomicrobia bacterium]|nr:hypothetical protein [Verrucomicrobiota bacterium]
MLTVDEVEAALPQLTTEELRRIEEGIDPFSERAELLRPARSDRGVRVRVHFSGVDNSNMA